MKKFPCLLICILTPIFILAQSPSPKEAIQKQVEQLFEGMYQGDSSMVREVLHPHVVFSSTSFDQEGHPKYSQGSAQAFLHAVGTPHEEVWDEQIHNLTIQVDDNLAVAWMDYRFYRGDQFSHCGVNAMTLVQTKQGWQILYLSDSRRKEPCTP